MVRILASVIIISTILTVIAADKLRDDKRFNCSENTPLDVDQGILVINKNVSCSFFTEKDSQVFAMRTDNLKLEEGDSIQITSDSGANFELKPPFYPGYLYVKAKQPKLTFKFNKPDLDVSMSAQFIQDKTNDFINLPIDSVNNDFRVVPYGEVRKLDFSFNKLQSELVHLEVNGAKIQDTSLRHVLLTNTTKKVSIEIQNSETIRVITSLANQDCSKTYLTDKETSQDITGLDATKVRQYKCVNIFRTTLKDPNAHYEVDFKDFLDLADIDDELTIEDSFSDDRLHIIKPQASLYSKQLISFRGKDLAVVYESPRKINPSQIQFKATVRAKSSGGVITEADKPLNFPKGDGQVRYEYLPDSQQYATIELINPLIKLKDTNLTVYGGNKKIAGFSDLVLPPILSLNNPGEKMVLVVSSKNLESLNNAIKFKSQASPPCHKFSTEVQAFSVDGGQGPCYWTIASTSNVGLIIAHNNLSPKGCLTIQPLAQDKPIFSRCDIDETDILPTFVLNRAFINVTLPDKKTRFDAVLSTSPYTTSSVLEPTAKVSLVSYGYPNSYPLWKQDESLFLNGTGLNYVLTLSDLDLRLGDQLEVNNVAVENIREDIHLSNTTVNKVTLKKSASQNNYDLRRGFNMTAERFDQRFILDTKKSQFATPTNTTSLYIKISTAGTKNDKFAQRLEYNITFGNTEKNFDLSVYDARSTRGSGLDDRLEYHGSTTSDTLLIKYRVNKPNSTLPPMTISYLARSCNVTSDHVCDNNQRCVPKEKLCLGRSYCDDGSDIKQPCSGGYTPIPKPNDTGIGGVSTFILSIFMLCLGAVLALYGPGLYKTLEDRFRNGQYTTFTSVE